MNRWLQLHSQCKECPVCKAGVDEKNVIPLYGRGTSGQDPRTKPVPGPEIPRRPAGQRPESQRAPQMGPFGFMAGPSAQFGNFTLSAGFGLFPSLLGLQWQAYTGDPAPAGFAPREDGSGVAPIPRAALTPEQQQQAFLSRLLVMLGSFVLLCLLFF
jgi:E3 ubiquitin-protein ligase RNF5